MSDKVHITAEQAEVLWAILAEHTTDSIDYELAADDMSAALFGGVGKWSLRAALSLPDREPLSWEQFSAIIRKNYGVPGWSDPWYRCVLDEINNEFRAKSQGMETSECAQSEQSADSSLGPDQQPSGEDRAKAGNEFDNPRVHDYIKAQLQPPPAEAGEPLREAALALVAELDELERTGGLCVPSLKTFNDLKHAALRSASPVTPPDCTCLDELPALLWHCAGAVR